VKAFHGFLEGIVQGVGMRYFVYKSATRMNLRGFVKNLPDGRVELYLEGDEAKIQALLEYIKNSPVGRVDKIDGKWMEHSSTKFKGFEVRY